MGKQYKQLIPFVGVQPIPGVPGMIEEVVIGKREGARGVKMHPGTHFFFPDDRQFWPFYGKCQELGLTILSDSGPYEGVPAGVEYSEPVHWTDVLRDFPRLTLVLAHLGSGFWDERLDLARQFPNVYFDTSQGFSTPSSTALHGYRGLPAVDAVRIMRRIGVERIMYGSDAPIGDPVSQLEEILALDLTEPEKRMVLGENARRILKI